MCISLTKGFAYLEPQTDSLKQLEPLTVHILLVVDHLCHYYSTMSSLSLGLTGVLS